MLAYFLKRAVMTLLVLLVVMVLLALLVNVVPGDPAKTILGSRATPAVIARVRESMDLDKPVPVQVINFIKSILRGSLGTDVFSGQSINTQVKNNLPHTLVLAWVSLGLAMLVGIPLGVYSATHPNSWPDRIIAVISISFVSMPSYVIGLFLLLIFAVWLRVMPAMGVGEQGDVGDYIKHLILPAIALAVGWVGYLARLVRSSTLEILNETYIRAAMASGIRKGLVQYKYALKGALIPTVAVLGVGIGNLMGGAVFAEIIFNRPGMGSLIFHAIGTRNYPVVRAGVLVVAVLFVVANLLADISYTYLDPRIQLGKTRG
jgi:peptide/nickel transport system permease protein